MPEALLAIGSRGCRTVDLKSSDPVSISQVNALETCTEIRTVKDLLKVRIHRISDVNGRYKFNAKNLYFHNHFSRCLDKIYAANYSISGVGIEKL